jgi:hypothetical protein
MVKRTTANGFSDVKWRRVFDMAGAKLSIVLLKSTIPFSEATNHHIPRVIDERRHVGATSRL